MGRIGGLLAAITVLAVAGIFLVLIHLWPA